MSNVVLFAKKKQEEKKQAKAQTAKAAKPVHSTTSVNKILDENKDTIDLAPKVREKLEKQQYGFAGKHSAVKECEWTKRDLKGEGSCYKHKFYGISSHECMQMTTSMACANRCTFCWRDYNSPVAKEWKDDYDQPEDILQWSLDQHYRLLVGFKGHPKVDPQKFENAIRPRHVALSLVGEPLLYPKMNELIDLFHQNHITTFLVTNGQYPDKMRELKEITQLYLSVDAPNKEIMKEVDRPIFEDYWERFLEACDILATKKEKTACRMTLMKGINMCEAENYATIFKKANADHIEVKGYTHVGAAKGRLSGANSPNHEEIYQFAKEIEKHVKDAGYKIVSEHIPSRIVLLAKTENTQINFEQFFKDLEQK